MQQFIAKYQDQIEGSLCGLDRIVLSGTLRRLSHAKGMDTYLLSKPDSSEGLR